MEEYRILAKKLNSINWEMAQSDDPYENDKIHWLICELEDMDSKKAIRLLLNVLETSVLSNKQYNTENPFKDMSDFKHLTLTDYTTNVTKDGKSVPEY